ncbi:MAG: polyprenyl synthetase family protein [Lachnospiraceae bacterium]|nr:polyprenyl synthetase family protein [Lachnospiraceae bacterium]
MNFEEKRNKKTDEINVILQRYMLFVQGAEKAMVASMQYATMNGGKRIRPMLLLETYLLFGGSGKEMEPFMAALEMIHNYSLVHDDLPAMDNDDYRRGRKTTHKVYGEGMAILTGDALLNHAFESALLAFEIAPDKYKEIAKALQVLAKKAGVHGMIGGQVMDIASVGKQISQETLDCIYALKTSALMEAGMMIGAILAGATDEEVAIVEDVASKIGLAFQIQDDVLDVVSSLEELGKATHSDEKNEKTTYVTIKGLTESKREVETLSQTAIANLRSLGKENLFLEELLLSLVYRKY